MATARKKRRVLEAVEWDAVARMWEAGWSQNQLAVRFGVTQQTVSAKLRAMYGADYAAAVTVHDANRDGRSNERAWVGTQSASDVAWDMFRQGWAPSEIDRAMKMPRGTAHAAVVGRWADDKEKHERMRAQNAGARVDGWED